MKPIYEKGWISDEWIEESIFALPSGRYEGLLFPTWENERDNEIGPKGCIVIDTKKHEPLAVIDGGFSK